MEEEAHSVAFARYTRMVQLLLYRALELKTGEMRVIIAQQGVDGKRMKLRSSQTSTKPLSFSRSATRMRLERWTIS